MNKAFSGNLRINNMNKILFFILIIIFSLTLGIFLSKQEITNFFLLGNLEGVKSSLYRSNGSHIEPHELAPGYSMMILFLHRICGVSIINVAFLPIGILIIPIAYFVLVKRIFNSDIIAFGCAFYVILDIYQTGLYNTFVYTYTRPIYLLCIMLCLYIFKKGKRTVYVIPLLLMFIGVVFLHYTVPIWIITFLLVIYIISKVEKNNTMAHWSTTILLFIVIYFSFNQIVYKVFVPSFASMTYGTSHHKPILDIWLKFEAFLFGEGITLGKYEYYPVRGIFDNARLLLNIVILIPIIVSLPKIIKKFYINMRNRCKGPKFNFDLKFYIYCGFLVSILVQAVLYGIVFHISNQFFMFLGLPIALIALGLLQVKKKVILIFLMVCLAIMIISFSFSLSYIGKEPNYSLTKPSADWLFNNTNRDTKPMVMSGIEELHYYYFIGVNYNKSIWFSYFTSDKYDSMVSHNNSDLNKWGDYVVIDKYSYSLRIMGHKGDYFKALSHYDVEINTNPSLNKIYNDGNVWIYKPKR